MDEERKVYRIAKHRNNKSKDVEGSKVIKGEDNKLRYQDKEVLEMWKKHFQRLLNDEEDEKREETVCQRLAPAVREKEVETALRRMGKGRVVGPDGIPVEMWKVLG